MSHEWRGFRAACLLAGAFAGGFPNVSSREDKHHLSSPPTGELEEAPNPQNCRGVVAKYLHCFVLEEERSSGVSGVNPVVVPNG
ncbi:hypothetical protein CDAR_611821 [Caerostris darwini]|uniref:Secreted protein n=1 Tax=Caerostris darwini TaxID=1538125 RepID=A0AAV4MU77_9ARAC|nr:hypothetical protein CDAR_611821 [Caerostris darwini]